jgi:shikimate dehydrogenase
LPEGVTLGDFPALCGVLDAIYHPLRTELVSEALRLGIPATGGLPMLVAQAVAATEWFLDIKIPTDIIRTVSVAIEAQKQNIVLIGMPASGKTTVGRLLSEQLQMPLVDTDEEIVRVTGLSPADIIRERGESAFRDIETQVIRDRIAPLSGVIVATGRGAILREENIRRLKRNGKLVFLDRPLASLEATQDRPLSSDRDLLRQRYEERYPRYCAVADVHLPVSEGETPQTTACRVLENV